MLSHFLTVQWLGQFVSLPHSAVAWSVCISLDGAVCWSVYIFPRSAVNLSVCLSSSRCCGLVSLCLFLTVLWVGQFMLVSHGAMGWLVHVCSSRCCGLVSVCLSFGAVGWSVYVCSSRCCGLVSLCLFLTVLWVGQFMFVSRGAMG